MKLRNLSGVAVVVLLLAAACTPAATTAPGTQAPGTDAPATDAPAPGTDTPEPGVDTPPPDGEAPQDPLGVVTIPPGEPIHIAFWGVLTGANASLGEDARRGFVIAVTDREAMLLDRSIRMTFQDALCTPEGGSTTAANLAADVTIVGLIGSVCSDETVGGISLLTDAGMTTISPSNTRPDLTTSDRGAEYAGYLRTAHSDAIQGAVVAEFVTNELNATTAATLHDGSAYAEALVGVFEEEFAGLGGSITLAEAVVRDATAGEIRPALERIAPDSPEVLFMPLFTAEFGHVVSQIREIPGLENTVMIGADAGFSADALVAGGPSAVGMYLSSPDFTAFGPEYQGFLERYQLQFASAPIQAFHAHGFDATNILLDAIEQVAVAGADGTLYVPRGALRDAIFATENFEGITGTLSCDDYGDCSSPVIGIYQVTQENLDQATTPTVPVWRPGD